MHTFETFENGEARVRWVADECYQSEGSYAYDTEEETQAAVDAEVKGLEDGSLSGPYGIIWERKCSGECGGWYETDSLWGVILDHWPTEKDAADFC